MLPNSDAVSQSVQVEFSDSFSLTYMTQTDSSWLSKKPHSHTRARVLRHASRLNVSCIWCMRGERGERGERVGDVRIMVVWPYFIVRPLHADCVVLNHYFTFWGIFTVVEGP